MCVSLSLSLIDSGPKSLRLFSDYTRFERYTIALLQRSVLFRLGSAVFGRCLCSAASSQFLSRDSIVLGEVQDPGRTLGRPHTWDVADFLNM